MKSYSEFMEYIKENVTDYLPERETLTGTV